MDSFSVGHTRLLAVLASVAAFLAASLAARTAAAHVGGIDSTQFPANVGCLDCHYGGTTPDVHLGASSAELDLGQPITLTLTVTTPNGTDLHPGGGAGFNLRTDKPGTFAVGGPSSALTRIVVGSHGQSEATHSAAKEGEPATFTVLWTPDPATSGEVTFVAWGNAVNEDGTAQGDSAATTTLVLSVCSTPTRWYRDADGDGYGNAAESTTSCAAPVGYVSNDTDCDDTSAATHPGAVEICNGIDDNCNGGVDEGLPTQTFYRDADGDGYGNPDVKKVACSLAQAGAGYVADNTDCDDTDPNVHPGATEICGNMKDDNCNGIVDVDAPQDSVFYRDADGDGYGSASSGTIMGCAPPPGYVSNNADCDDGDAAIHPGAPEVCNGRDDNCMGGVDEGLGTITCGNGPCRTTVESCVNGRPQACAPACPDAGAASDAAAGGAMQGAAVPDAAVSSEPSDFDAGAVDLPPCPSHESSNDDNGGCGCRTATPTNGRWGSSVAAFALALFVSARRRALTRAR
jgi:hypothetical protein